MSTYPTVFVVDDDAAVRDSLWLQLEAAGFTTKGYASGNDFLAAVNPQTVGCLILDVRMPVISGPDLQLKMAERNIRLPIIFLTAYGDIPLAVKSIQAGAIDFLTKPVNGDLLVRRIHAALNLNAKQLKEEETKHQLIKRLAVLSEREREVLTLALEGLSNKEIARRLDLSFRTVEHHRSNILMKTGATNMIELSHQVENHL